MPYRSLPRLFPPCRRFLHHSAAALKATHYETLGIPTTASAKEIKTAFYHLSKLSHPDRNPADPTASTRFVHINEAYSVLRSPTTRHRYDRDIGLHNPHPRASHPVPATPSQSHYGPAGGRAPSGLSRRRATFRGAPPSFYRSGGWGEHSAKRRAAQEGSAGAAGGGEGRPKTEGGMGWGQSAWVAGEEEARHFDRESHLRTHSKHERRMKGRMRGSGGGEGGEGGREEEAGGRGMLGDFLIVSGLIFGGIAAPWWWPRLWGGGNKRKKDGV